MDDIKKFNDSVQVISGLFKGVKGTVSEDTQINLPNATKIEVRVDWENTIMVSSKDVEFLDKEYLIYVVETATGKISSEYLPFTKRLDPDDLIAYIKCAFDAIEPREEEPLMVGRRTFCKTFIKKPNKFMVLAMLLSNAKNAFKFQEVSVDGEALKSLLNCLK